MTRGACYTNKPFNVIVCACAYACMHTSVRVTGCTQRVVRTGLHIPILNQILLLSPHDLNSYGVNSKPVTSHPIHVFRLLLHNKFLLGFWFLKCIHAIAFTCSRVIITVHYWLELRSTA